MLSNTSEDTMRFTTKTEYGLFCLIHMATNDSEMNPITIKDMIRDEHYSQTYVEKILQALRQANIVVSVQGSQGGYKLARQPSQIKLREIVEALEHQTFDVFCAPQIRKDIVCNHYPLCGVRTIWEKTKELLDNFYETITLEMVARGEINLPQVVFASKT